MAKIFIYDEFTPEDLAMMQALYSRSASSVTQHVEKVKTTGSGKFMEKFYVAYGHNSIADCGSTTVFIEGLSVLADKAIQDWPLYSGQETSTRYIDMSKQVIIDPINTPQSKEILAEWMNFYTEHTDKLHKFLKEKYPKKPDEDENVYQKAINARGFDIMRGFLPAGITTQLSWHTNLRQAADKLALLKHNPLPEVAQIAKNIHQNLAEKYANSFSHKLYSETEDYRDKCQKNYNFFNPQNHPEFKAGSTIDKNELEEYNDLISTRPPKTNLPHFLTELGLITFDFLLDFGSFRDIQRHRNGVCRMPLLSTNYGFNNWYLEQLPSDLEEKAKNLLAKQEDAIDKLETNDLIKQYYIAMGYNVACRVTYGLPACVYVVELRSGKPVHPSLRKVAHKMHKYLINQYPKLKLHSDLDPDDWDIRRGLQDIKEKK